MYESVPCQGSDSVWLQGPARLGHGDYPLPAPSEKAEAELRIRINTAQQGQRGLSHTGAGPLQVIGATWVVATNGKGLIGRSLKPGVFAVCWDPGWERGTKQHMGQAHQVALMESGFWLP